MEHIYFQLYRAHLDGVIWKKPKIDDKHYKQTSLYFYASNDVCKQY